MYFIQIDYKLIEIVYNSKWIFNPNKFTNQLLTMYKPFTENSFITASKQYQNQIIIEITYNLKNLIQIANVLKRS